MRTKGFISMPAKDQSCSAAQGAVGNGAVGNGAVGNGAVGPLPNAPVLRLAGADYASSLFAEPIRMAFALLQSAIEESAGLAERRNVQIAKELDELQARALRSLQDSARATIDLFEAIGAARTPSDIAGLRCDLARRQAANTEQLVDFMDLARNMVGAITEPLPRRIGVSPSTRERGPTEEGDSLLSRLNKLTNRQKKVLELLAEGLPNKVIAHELGISETTVKAHVGEILRKLKVYNRARAIVMLAQFDTSQIGVSSDPH
jgi:DNA-binding NarL/FixJ family response regulator